MAKQRDPKRERFWRQAVAAWRRSGQTIRDLCAAHACRVHARKKFADAENSDPERALAGKAFIRQLYDVEDEAKAEIARLGLNGADAATVFLRLRQQKARPMLEAFRTWLVANNLSERTLKLVGIGRDNRLHLGSDQGGTTAAVFYSFTATCKSQGIDTFAYLRDVLAQLPAQPAEQLEELLLHRWQAARLAATAPIPTP